MLSLIVCAIGATLVSVSTSTKSLSCHGTHTCLLQSRHDRRVKHAEAMPRQRTATRPPNMTTWYLKWSTHYWRFDLYTDITELIKTLALHIYVCDRWNRLNTAVLIPFNLRNARLWLIMNCSRNSYYQKISFRRNSSYYTFTGSGSF